MIPVKTPCPAAGQELQDIQGKPGWLGSTGTCSGCGRTDLKPTMQGRSWPHVRPCDLKPTLQPADKLELLRQQVDRQRYEQLDLRMELDQANKQIAKILDILTMVRHTTEGMQSAIRRIDNDDE